MPRPAGDDEAVQSRQLECCWHHNHLGSQSRAAVGCVAVSGIRVVWKNVHQCSQGISPDENSARVRTTSLYCQTSLQFVCTLTARSPHLAGSWSCTHTAAMPRNLLLCALLGSLLLLTAPFPAVSAEDDVDEKDVVVLTDKNFDTIIKGAKFALVRASRRCCSPPAMQGQPLGADARGRRAWRRWLAAITRPPLGAHAPLLIRCPTAPHTRRRSSSTPRGAATARCERGAVGWARRLGRHVGAWRRCSCGGGGGLPAAATASAFCPACQWPHPLSFEGACSLPPARQRRQHHALRWRLP